MATLDADLFRVWVFVGASQQKFDREVVLSIQRFGDRGHYIEIARNGRNALDFHIACYIGLLSEREPTAQFTIISKDTGFDPLIEHLRARRPNPIRVQRLASIEAITPPKPAPAKPAPAKLEPAQLASAKTRPQQIELIYKRITGINKHKPERIERLSNMINAWYQKKLSQNQLAQIIAELQACCKIAVEGGKVTYLSAPARPAPTL